MIQPIPAKLFLEALNNSHQILQWHLNRNDSAKTTSVKIGDALPFTFSSSNLPGREDDYPTKGPFRWVEATHTEHKLHEPGLISALFAIKSLNLKIRNVLDVGASYGYFTFAANRIINPKLIHAIEPNPYTNIALRNHIRLNGPYNNCQITARRILITDTNSHLVPYNVKLMEFSRISNGRQIKDLENVFCISESRLDDFCIRNSFQPCIIKIDVEGFQSKIIPSALNVINTHRPIIFLECDWMHVMNRFDSSNYRVIKQIIDLGYNLIFGNHRNMQPYSFKIMKLHEFNSSHEVNSLAILLPADC